MFFGANLQVAWDATRTIWDSIPENAPDFAYALRGVVVCEKAVGEMERLLPTVSETNSLRDGAAMSLRQMRFWLGRLRESIAREGLLTTADALSGLREQIALLGQDIDAGGPELAERRQSILMSEDE